MLLIGQWTLTTYAFSVTRCFFLCDSGARYK